MISESMSDCRSRGKPEVRHGRAACQNLRPTRRRTSVLRVLPGPVKGAFAFVLFSLNTVFWCLLLYVVALVRLVLPFASAKKVLTRWAMAIGENWVSVN